MNDGFSSGAVAAHWHDSNGFSARPSSPFIVGSFVFHLLILLIVTGQFAFFHKSIDPEEMIIVDMVNAPIDDKTSPPDIKPVSLDKPDLIDKKKPKPAKRYVPPKSESKPVTPPENKEEPLKSKAAPVPEEDIPAPAPMEKAETAKPPVPQKPAPIPVKRPKVAPKAPAKEVKKDNKKDKEQKKAMDFQSVLKNLADSKAQPAQATAEKDAKPRQSPMLTQPPPVSEQVSQSEMQALISQLGGCWNMLTGAKDAENLIVDVRITVNSDRTLRSYDIVDKMRYNSDPFYRAAADSAVRALNDPRCRVLNLPPYKYEQWKSMTVRFDPKQMF